jgi:hypothetical protein
LLVVVSGLLRDAQLLLQALVYFSLKTLSLALVLSGLLKGTRIVEDGSSIRCVTRTWIAYRAASTIEA